MSTVLQSEWLTNEASYVLSYQASGPMNLFFASLAVSMQDQACSIRVLPEMTIAVIQLCYPGIKLSFSCIFHIWKLSVENVNLTTHMFYKLLLATQAGKMEPSCPLGTTRCIPQAKFHQKPYNKSFNDQVCSVKMAGYWPRSFFASLWNSTSSRSINTQKKKLANTQPSWPHTWSITHTYCIKNGNKLLTITRILRKLIQRKADEIWNTTLLLTI